MSQLVSPTTRTHALRPRRRRFEHAATERLALPICAHCGHSRRNHEHERDRCARALCDCANFR